MKCYKSSYLSLILSLVLSLLFFLFLASISKSSLEVSAITIALLYIGWFSSFLSRKRTDLVCFDDLNKKLNIKRVFWQSTIEEYDYGQLFYEIKDYHIGRQRVKNVLFVYQGEKNILIIGDSLVSGWKAEDISAIKDKVVSLGIRKV